MSLLARARELGADDLQPSWRKTKKWAVLYQGRWVHFGALGYSDFTQHKDPVRRADYRRRHGAILTKKGVPAHKVKSQAAYWSWTLLWT